MAKIAYRDALREAIREEMIRDPECGTYVPRNDAIKTQAEGKTCYFCSTECRDKYLERS